jgi:hypothetical protein
MFVKSFRLVAFAASAALIHTLSQAHKAPAAVPLLPRYQQECAACHVAYPPGMLPAESWQRVVNGLPNHFGTDASLDAETVRQLWAWLAANAGAARRSGEQPPEDRITRSAWFVHEHDEVPASTWKLPAVKSPANCAACHAQAEQGDFDEHRVHIPR